MFYLFHSTKSSPNLRLVLSFVGIVVLCVLNFAQAEEKANAGSPGGDPDSDDYYKVLGVPRDADTQTIKKSYRRMALRYHPDKAKKDNIDPKEAQNRFVKIGRAYEVLSDPRNRQIYDQFGKEGVENMGGDAGGGGEGFPFEFPFGGGGGAEDMHFSFSDPFELFKNMFQGEGNPFGFGGDMGEGDSGFTITFGGGGGDFGGGFGFGDTDSEAEGFDLGSIFGFGDADSSRGERIDTTSEKRKKRSRRGSGSGSGMHCETTKHCNQFGCKTVQHCQ